MTPSRRRWGLLDIKKAGTYTLAGCVSNDMVHVRISASGVTVKLDRATIKVAETNALTAVTVL